MPKFRSAYDEVPRVHPEISDESRAKQSMKDECDINQIVDRFRQTGLVSHLAQGHPRYLDVSEMGDYREALDQVTRVSDFFMGLPADLRSRFDNDPAAFIDFMSDPANADEIAALGLEDVEVEPTPSRDSDGPEEPAEGSGEPASEAEPSE